MLPAYNEAAGLPDLLAGIDESMFEADLRYTILVVDDGSRDGTAEVAREHAERLPLLVVAHESNQGLGASIRVSAAPNSPLRKVYTVSLVARSISMVRRGGNSRSVFWRLAAAALGGSNGRSRSSSGAGGRTGR